MITKTTATTALILTVFALGGGAFVYTEVAPTPAAYAQLSDIDDMVDDALDTDDMAEEEEEEERKQGNIAKQSIDQVHQVAIDKSDQSDENSNNIQIQSGPANQDIAHGALNSNDFEKSSSGSAYAKEEYSSFTYKSTDDLKKANQHEAGYDEELTQEEETVHQGGSLIPPTHDTAALNPANVATSIALPVNALLEDELE
jgi:hypothetical protein